MVSSLRRALANGAGCRVVLEKRGDDNHQLHDASFRRSRPMRAGDFMAAGDFSQTHIGALVVGALVVIIVLAHVIGVIGYFFRKP